MDASRLATTQPSIRVLMLPWLAHGHISPFLELGKKLCSNNIAVYLCSTPANLSSVEKRIDSEAFPHLHLVELHLPADEDLPPHLHTTKNLPSHLMPALKTAFDRSAPTFSRLLDSLSPHPLFLPIAACTAAFFIHHLTRSPEDQFPFPSPRFPRSEAGEIMAMVNTITNGISDGERVLQCLSRSDGFVALRSFREIEAKYIDYFSSIIQKEVVPVRRRRRAAEGERNLRRKGIAGGGMAAQKKILAHPSVGGFVTHCGWSSVMEAGPADKCGARGGAGNRIEVREGGGCKFDGDEVARCIKEVVVGEKTGEGVRRRAKEMARVVSAKGDEEINWLLEKIHLLVAALGSSAGNERRVQRHEVGSTSAVPV
ncbi:Flavanone 7-O-glucoside 2''-O-beta-L-rhamnosyltransferase [Platanthera guangdongensis]|uniref:Flavanone 7-O-glucoside 2''-O-beta-L-rhamnosyltransferase n=1 Tax=Platanthera guangdongensis TaxID=2320717 RepID=A0ABR2MJU4_9ASPA